MMLTLLITLHCALPQAWASVTLTAINDSILSYSASTAPVRKNGEYYVPYTTFSYFGIAASYDATSNTVSLSQNGVALYFNASQGTAYDHNGTTFAFPPYLVNGTIYVPVRLVCSKFGLQYSVINADSTVLRIYSSAAKYSDSAFISANTAQITASSGSTSTSSGTTTPSTATETEEVEVFRPTSLSFSYQISTDEAALTALLDTLDTQKLSATLLLPCEEFTLSADVLRRMVGSGYTVGFWADSTTTVADLTAANAVLQHATGTVSRIVCATEELPDDTLQQAGYRVYLTSHQTADDAESTADEQMQTLRAQFETSNNPAQLLIPVNPYAAALTVLLLQYAHADSIPTQEITLFSDIFIQ